MLFSRSAFQHACLACTRLATGFGVALGWLWGGFGGALVEPWWSLGGALVEPWWSLGGALVEPWWSLGGALGWLCTPDSMPSICLQYGLGVALGGFPASKAFEGATHLSQK